MPMIGVKEYLKGYMSEEIIVRNDTMAITYFLNIGDTKTCLSALQKIMPIISE